jgi:hypothetical protein
MCLTLGIGLGYQVLTNLAQGDLIPMPSGEATPVQMTKAEYSQHLFVTERLPLYEAAINESQRIVYALDSSLVSDNLLIAPKNLQGIFPQLLIVGSQAELSALHEQAPIQGMIIHVSALTWIEMSWVQYHYLNGMPVLSIDMSFGQHAQITGDYCGYPVTEQTAHGNAFTWDPRYAGVMGHTTINSYWLFYPANPEQRQTYASYLAGECELRTGGVGGYLSAGNGASFIRTQEDLPLLIETIRTTAATIAVELALGPAEEQFEARWQAYLAGDN